MDYKTLADESSVGRTADALKQKGYEVFVVDAKEQALEKIKTLVPAGASVMNGASETLEQIGYTDYLKAGNHPWVDLRGQVDAENDKGKRAQLRKLASLSDFYLGSVHALMENGEFLNASNTGSQLPHIASTSPNLIFVVGTQKIVPDFAAAMRRLETYVVPLEEENMRKRYNMGTNLNKLLISKGEVPFMNRKIRFILVRELLGF
jgi:hypothetical protein